MITTGYTEIAQILKRSLPFMVVAFSFVGLAYGYGHSLAPLPLEDQLQLMRVCGTFLP